MLTKEQLTHKLKVKKKVPETDDTYSFVLEIPAELKDKFNYKAGQFVTLFVEPKAEEVRRSYSLSSSPDWDEEFKISVKRVDGGLVSNWLIDEVNEGDFLHVTPPAGLFCLPKEHSSEFVFIAGGSGITPVISLIKSALKTVENSRIALLYCSRNEESVIFHRELRELTSKYPDRFRYENNLTQPLKEFSGRKGRLHSTDIRDFWNENECSPKAQHFLCGPDGLMTTAEAALELLGVPRDNLHRESFTAASTSNTESDYLESVGDDAVFIGDKTQADTPLKIEAEVDGEWVSVDAKEGLSVLETLLEAGHNPPYSCMDGACMACMGKVQDGLVYQDDMGILTEDNTEVGECLTCQAKPASKKLKLTFEI